MSKWVCRNCETENEDSTSICSLCGAKRDVEYVANSQQSVPAYNPRQTNQYGRQQTFNTTSSSTQAPSNGDALRELINKYDKQKNLFKGLAIIGTIVQLILYYFKYVKNESNFTIYKNCAGINGSIEQICSILLVCITVAPAIVVCVKLNVRKRNLPITISVIVAILTTIYSAVIWFGNPYSTVIPALIIVVSWAIVIFAINMVKTLNQLDNAMYRPTGF